MWSAEEFIKALRSFDIRSGFMMRHIKSVDSQTHTILMIQVENEIAVFGEDRHINPKLWRDHSPVSNQRFAQNRFADDLTFSANCRNLALTCTYTVWWWSSFVTDYQSSTGVFGG